jgi:hypothetical protein
MNVYIGWDSRETDAYRVAEASIRRHASCLVDVIPIRIDDVRQAGILTRPVERRDGKMWCPISEAPMSTEFAISRFTVPWLQQAGLAVFADCDILCMADIAELFALHDPKYAVQVVKHDYHPTNQTKMDGQVQTVYHRKNWSSVILWNLDHPAHKRLTHEILNSWPGRDLHAFKWLQDDEIGALPGNWNLLVDVEPWIGDGKILHFTNGGPWIPGWQGGSWDWMWSKEFAECRGVVNG